MSFNAEDIPGYTEFTSKFVEVGGFELSQALCHIADRSRLLPQPLLQVSSTFLESISANERISSLPFALCQLFSLGNFQEELVNIQMQVDRAKEQIRRGIITREQVPHLLGFFEGSAEETYLELIHSPQGRDNVRYKVFQILFRSTAVMAPQVLSATQNLLSQSTISLWSAMETFISDFVRILLNLDPSRSPRIFSDPDCKARFNKQKWSLEQLFANGLDLSSKVGDLMLSENDLSDLNSMKAILLPLFDRPSDLVRVLEDDSIYLLGKTRHLLVHRGGHVDAKFERETSSRWREGTVLTVSANELKNYAKMTVIVINEIIEGYLSSIGNSLSIEKPAALNF